MKKKIPIFLLFTRFLFSVHSDPENSAGVIERELQKEYEESPKAYRKDLPSIQVDIPEKQLNISDTEKVRVDSVILEGNRVFTEKEIQKWLEGDLHQNLSLRGMHALCDLIEYEYAKRGFFLTRAYLPPQEMQEGVLKIEILEGELGQVTVKGNKYYSEAFVLSYFSSLRGEAVHYDRLIRALLLLNENIDLQAGIIFERGQEVGTADLIVEVKDHRPTHLYFNTNNYGKDLTTNFRAGGRFDQGNIVTYGDLFSLAEVVGFPMNALYFTDAKYKIPLTRNGAFLEMGYLFNTSRVQEERELRLHGKSMIASLKGTQAIVRGKQVSLDFFSAFDYKQIGNFQAKKTASFDKLRVFTTGFIFDKYATTKGRDYGTLSARAGIPSFLGGLKTTSQNSSRPGAAGRFFAANLDYDRFQQLAEGYLFHFHGSGQFSFNKLTVPEQIYIGGSDTVRGYPVAVSLGDSGYYVNFEFLLPPFPFQNICFGKTRLKDRLQLICFLDQGGTFFYPGVSTFLWGSGMGLRLQGPWNLALNFDVGFPLNHKSLSKGAFSYLRITLNPF